MVVKKTQKSYEKFTFKTYAGGRYIGNNPNKYKIVELIKVNK